MLTLLRYTPSDTKIIKNKVFPQKCGFAAKYTLRDFSIISPLETPICHYFYMLCDGALGE